jgi:hypothetical protein
MKDSDSPTNCSSSPPDEQALIEREMEILRQRLELVVNRALYNRRMNAMSEDTGQIRYSEAEDGMTPTSRVVPFQHARVSPKFHRSASAVTSQPIVEEPADEGLFVQEYDEEKAR